MPEIPCPNDWLSVFDQRVPPVLRRGEAVQAVSSLLRTNGAQTLTGLLLIGASGTEELVKRLLSISIP